MKSPICEYCRDAVPSDCVRMHNHRVCSNECYVELVHGQLSRQASSSVQTGRSDITRSDRQYHGDRWHSGEC